MEASSPNDGPHDRWGRQKGLTKGKDKTIHTCIRAFKFMRCLYSRFLCVRVWVDLWVYEMPSGCFRSYFCNCLISITSAKYAINLLLFAFITDLQGMLVWL